MTCFSAPAIAAPIIVRSVIKNGFNTKPLLVIISQHPACVCFQVPLVQFLVLSYVLSLHGPEVSTRKLKHKEHFLWHILSSLILSLIYVR